MVLVEQSINLNHFHIIQAVIIRMRVNFISMLKCKKKEKTVFIFVEFIQINFVSALLRSNDLCSHRTKHTVLHMASPTMIKEERGQRLREKETDRDRKGK